jgi:hypothetical protein
MRYKVEVAYLFVFVILSVSSLHAEWHDNESIPRPRITAPRKEKRNNVEVKSEGLRFSCDRRKLKLVHRQMQSLFDLLGIDPSLVETKLNASRRSLEYVLKTPSEDTSTVDFSKRAQFKLSDELIKLPLEDGSVKEVSAVSKKEILLAIMQHGRLTEFSGEDCSVKSLVEHIGIRQNISAWVEGTRWKWPDIEFGGKVKWNEKYWNRGDLLPGVKPSTALADIFKDPKKYQLACYTMAKVAMAHGIMDYYTRINPNPSIVKKIESQLMSDNEVLTDIDPTLDVDNVTAVERGQPVKDAVEVVQSGKILGAQLGVAANNWVPGDWGYFLNPERVSAGKAGYEGSNSIYMGRDKFDDYYDEHKGSYTFREKLEEVYQWRDKSIQEPITEVLLKQLIRTPGNGGIVENYRNVPFLY